MTHIRLELLPDSTKLNHSVFKVIEDCTITLSNGYELLIPKGYITDLSSIPKFLHSFMSPLHTGIRNAGIIHDYLYDNWTWLQYELPQCADRKWCDEEFRKQCKINWRRNVMYFILRVSPKAKRMYYD